MGANPFHDIPLESKDQRWSLAIIDRLYRERRSYFKGFAYYKVGDVLTAEDIVQEGFLLLLRVQDTIQSYSHSFFLMKNIIKHRVFNYYRSSERKKKFLDKLLFSTMINYMESPDYGRVDAFPLGHKLLKKIDSDLTPMQAIVIKLSLEGKYAKEIGEDIGKKRTAVERLKEEAILHLRRGTVASAPKTEITDKHRKIVEQMMQQKYTYTKIASETGLSIATIYRIKKKRTG